MLMSWHPASQLRLAPSPPQLCRPRHLHTTKRPLRPSPTLPPGHLDQAFQDEPPPASLGPRESSQPPEAVAITDHDQPRDDVYGAYDHAHFQTAAGPNQHTQQPIVTGTSVVAAKFKDGVVIAADNLGMQERIQQLRLPGFC
jgi:hypothetical protein